MDQTLTCPVCGYDNEWDGGRSRSFRCVRCESELRAPVGKVSKPDAPQTPEDKPRSGIWKILVLGLVGLKIAAIAGKIIFDMNKGPQLPPPPLPAQFQPPANGVPMEQDRPRAVPVPQPPFTLVDFVTEGLDAKGDLKLRIQIRRNFPIPLNERLILVTKIGEEPFRVPLQFNIALLQVAIVPFSLPAAFVPAGKHEATAWIETVPNNLGMPSRKLSGDVRVSVP